MGPRPDDRGNQGGITWMKKRKKLQWGRDLMIAETSIAASARRSGGIASMGPRPDDRGNSTPPILSTFQGCATPVASTWRCVLSPAVPSGAKDYAIFKEFKALNLSERLPYFSSHLTARNCFRCSRTNFNGR